MKVSMLLTVSMLNGCAARCMVRMSQINAVTESFLKQIHRINFSKWLFPLITEQRGVGFCCCCRQL